MTKPDIVETRSIKTPEGILTVEMTQAFIDKVRQHFGLLNEQPVEDAHIRSYVWQAVDVAVAKAEQELEHAGTEDTAEGVR